MPMTLPALDDFVSSPVPGAAAVASNVLLPEQALQQILLADAAVVALVGARIYSPVLPQTVTYPAISIQLDKRDSVRQLNNRGSTGLAVSGYRIAAISQGPSKYAQAKRIAEAVRLALEGYSGTVTDSTVSPIESVRIQLISPEGSRDHYDDATQIHRVIADFDVWAGEQQP